MSLINDALKRARHQALEQEADGTGVSYRAVPAHSRRPERVWVPYLVGGGTVALVMAVVLLMRPEGETEVTPATSPGEAAAVAADSMPNDSPTAGTGLGDEASRADSPPSAEATSGPEEPLETSASPGEVSGESSRPETPSPVEAPPSSPSPEPESGIRETPPVLQEAGARLEAGRTYLRRVVAMDGSDVVLGGIAYSESRPIAVINGSVVTPGDMVSGFTVIGITPEHVELEADGVRIFLALH